VHGFATWLSIGAFSTRRCSARMRQVLSYDEITWRHVLRCARTQAHKLATQYEMRVEFDAVKHIVGQQRIPRSRIVGINCKRASLTCCGAASVASSRNESILAFENKVTAVPVFHWRFQLPVDLMVHILSMSAEYFDARPREGKL
jgi:hypothetical protein